MLQKKPEGVGSGGRVKSYAPLWELGRGGFLNVSFPRISEFLLWRKPSLTFYFLSWCESVASGQVQQVSSRWGWFWGLRSPWLHAGMEVSVSWALQRLVNVDYTTFTRRQDVLSTFFFFFWSSLTMCGWKEDKVCSALFSASGRQLRRKAYLLMSGKAEVNLDWSWLKKVWGSAMSSSTERFHRWAHHCFNFIATFFWKVLLCLFCFLPLRNTFNQFPATALVLPWRH